MRGVVWMVLAMSCIGIVDALAKVLGARLSGVQVAWGYFLAMWLSLMLWSMLHGTHPRQLIGTARPRLQWFRALCLVMSLVFLFSALRVLPLAEATTISFTAPLFVVALAGPLLHESVGARRWTAVLLGMGGALLVVRPGSAMFVWASLLPLAGAVFFALFSIVTRMLGARERTATTLFYTTGAGTLILSAVQPFVWTTPNLLEVGVFALSGALGLAAHLGIVRAMHHAEASVVAPLNYVRLVWALSLGVALFGDWPEPLELAGGAIIVASGLYVVYGAARER